MFGVRRCDYDRRRDFDRLRVCDARCPRRCGSGVYGAYRAGGAAHFLAGRSVKCRCGTGCPSANSSEARYFGSRRSSTGQYSATAISSAGSCGPVGLRGAGCFSPTRRASASPASTATRADRGDSSRGCVGAIGISSGAAADATRWRTLDPITACGPAGCAHCVRCAGCVHCVRCAGCVLGRRSGNCAVGAARGIRTQARCSG